MVSWFRKVSRLSSSDAGEMGVVPDELASEKQVVYIVRLVGEAGSEAKSVVKKVGIRGDPSSLESYANLSKTDAGRLIGGLLSVIPATEPQVASIVHNFSLEYVGMSAEDKADFAKAMEIAAPSGDPGDVSSYSHLSKGDATAALRLIRG